MCLKEYMEHCQNKEATKRDGNGVCFLRIVKGTVHPQMKIQTLFTHAHVSGRLDRFLSTEGALDMF